MANLARIFNTINPSKQFISHFLVGQRSRSHQVCKLLIVGGGTGGVTVAAKAVKALGPDSVIVVEPSENHYYQPLWTLVGAGCKRLQDTKKPTGRVLPKEVVWVKDSVGSFDPDNNKVVTAGGDSISYEYMVVAVGLQNHYEKVSGLQEALDAPDSCVSTIYDHRYVEKTWRNVKEFNGGVAVFTYPDSPIKCAGAPQKMCYLAESYFHESNVRVKTKIIYNTSLPVIFGVKKYADQLVKVAERKHVDVNYRTSLKAVDPITKIATFYCNEDPNNEVKYSYDLLHVAPPMRTPECLRTCKSLVDQTGFLDVDRGTLQHQKYFNIFGLGDCTNTPNAKTAAAVAGQSVVVWDNVSSLISKTDNKPSTYNGYGACPLLTSYNTCMLCEFLYDGVVHETFPFNQAKESKMAFYMKKDLFPFIYWNFMLKGNYDGPEFVRKIVNPFGK